MNLVRTLKFQIGAALLLIVVLFCAVFAWSLASLEQQRSYNTLLNITARLESSAQQLVSLGMNYAMNKPRDNQAYQRDVKLYYQEIRSRADLIDELTDSFMHENFAPSLTSRTTPFRPHLDPAIRTAVRAVEEAWANFRGGLDTATGADQQIPRLTEAGHFISVRHQPFTEAVSALRAQIQRLSDSRLDRMNQVYWSMLIAIIAITFGILAWFVLFVLRPLNRAVIGFQQVARGDFGYQVSTDTGNELNLLSHSFNQLSSRLHAIFRLIDRIQQGSDLDDTLCFVAEQFPSLLPLDWVGALFVAGDNSTIILERSYREGRPEIARRSRFRLQGTLLQKALEADEPLHIPDMMRTAENNRTYQFLRYLAKEGLRDAIFLPITEQSPIPGVLAFATREPDSYTPEHLELLTNIAKLVTHSFGRTVKLAEHTRLAAIGSFASGIAHEIRTPLSTINMALDYLHKTDLPAAARKRTELGQQEAKRMAKLLEEILLYAKPLKLELRPLNLADFLREFLSSFEDLPRQRGQSFELELGTGLSCILGDRDRLKQIFLNLANNASEAAPEGSPIRWHLSSNELEETLSLEIQNSGEPIQEAVLTRLFDPFFTTKASGTGLGLGIVKRMINAHGGEIQIRSDAALGTRVSVLIPLARCDGRDA